MQYPERPTGPLVMLTSVAPPVGAIEPARQTAADVLLSDGSWEAATVLAWHRLAQPEKQALTGHRIEWLVQLRLADGTESWHQYVSSCLRQHDEPI